MHDRSLRAQVHKRHLLNLFIQGAAAVEAFDCFGSYADEVARQDPRLATHYRRKSLFICVEPWAGLSQLLVGRSRSFWRRIRRPDHPYFGNAFLTRHGVAIDRESRRLVRSEAKRIGAPRSNFAAIGLLLRTLIREYMCGADKRPAQLARVAEQVVVERWAVPDALLHAQWTEDFACDPEGLIVGSTRRARLMRRAVVSYSRIERGDGGLYVYAQSGLWPALVHELFKGVAELACLHGLCGVDGETYESVLNQTDRLELETWGFRCGPALYVRLLAAVESPHRPPAALMHLSLMDPTELESFCVALIEDPLLARRLIMDRLDADAPRSAWETDGAC